MDPSLSLDIIQAPETTEENDQILDTLKNYDRIIETLEKRRGWEVVDHFYLYKDFWLSYIFLKGMLSAQNQFIAQSNDIVLCSSPKTGTTWLKALTFAIITRHKFATSSSPLLTTLPHQCIPFLEIEFGQNSFNRDPELPVISTHIPYTLLPKSITSSGCKIVYIYRDAKDSFVSLWHFSRKMKAEGKEPITLEDAFEQFTRGVSFYGPFWDHVLGYWKASLEYSETIFVMKYEDIKADSTSYVKKLAEFMGYSFTLEEEKKGIIENIVKLCSFENLSSLEVNKEGVYRLGARPVMVENNFFFRKGMIGDWKNYLTAEMADKIDIITEEKFGPWGLK